MQSIANMDRILLRNRLKHAPLQSLKSNSFLDVKNNVTLLNLLRSMGMFIWLVLIRSDIAFDLIQTNVWYAPLTSMY